MSETDKGVDFFLFDIVDDGVLRPDTYGIELPSWDEAHEEAKIIVCELMQDQSASIDERIVHVDVRSSKSGSVYRARVAFKAGWLEPGTA